MIINLDEARVSIRRGRSKNEKRAGCLHQQKCVDPRAREVWCATCEATLDPIDALAQLAGEGERLVFERKERKRLETERESLLNEIRNLKAQAKRWREKAGG